MSIWSTQNVDCKRPGSNIRVVLQEKVERGLTSTAEAAASTKTQDWHFDTGAAEFALGQASGFGGAKDGRGHQPGCYGCDELAAVHAWTST
jgi:hypothetical protein